jgi:hypothetical protein
MKKFYVIILAILSISVFTKFSSAQEQEQEMLRAISITAGIGYEFFSRTITWDDDYTSRLKSYFLTFNTKFEFGKGFVFSAILGYAIPGTNYKELTFRRLPISVELDVGSIKGYIVGTEIRKTFLYAKDLQVDVLGQFFYYMGTKKEWEIPDLAVEGTVEGNPSWMRVSVGPVFTYVGFESFCPYFYLNFNKLWGKFKMVEAIQDLTGSENKKISGTGSFAASLGSIFKITKTFSLITEGSFLPHGDGVDFGLTVRAMYSF